MKQIYFNILFLLIGYGGNAQGYISFPDSGATWVNGHYTVNYELFMCELSFVKNWCTNGNDTVISSTTYTKVEECNGPDYMGAFRNENGKVFFVPEGMSQEILMYDFTVEVGDTIYANTCGISFDYEISFIDSILVFNEYRKRIDVNGYRWVEGIGNIDSGLFGEVEGNVSGYCSDLECMSVNDSLLWPAQGLGTCQLDLSLDSKDFDFELFPNPSSEGIFTIKQNSTSASLTYKILTPNGQVVKEGELESNQIDVGPESGIYFIQISNGKGVFTRRIIIK